MKITTITIYLCFTVAISFSQTERCPDEFNFGFESLSPHQKLPDGWFNWGVGYDLTIDTIEKNTGQVSMRIQPTGDITEYDVGSIGYSIPMDIEGGELELRVYMKFMNVTDGAVYLAMLASDTSGTTLNRAHNFDLNIHGTSDWVMYSIKMQLPKNASTIFIGTALSGKGLLWVDDFQLLVDGKELEK